MLRVCLSYFYCLTFLAGTAHVSSPPRCRKALGPAFHPAGVYARCTSKKLERTARPPAALNLMSRTFVILVSSHEYGLPRLISWSPLYLPGSILCSIRNRCSVVCGLSAYRPSALLCRRSCLLAFGLPQPLWDTFGTIATIYEQR